MTTTTQTNPTPTKSTSTRAILVKAIIDKLNVPIKAKNESLCKQNLYADQSPLHGANMLFKLSFMTTEQIKHIASACGL